VIDGTFVATNAGGPSPIGLAPGTYTLDRAKGGVDPKITPAVQVTPWLQPYVTYSEALRVPTVQESQLGGDHPGGATVAFYPNPYLNPELLKGWDLGAKIKANGLLVSGDSLRLKVDYFNNNINDYIRRLHRLRSGCVRKHTWHVEPAGRRASEHV
jgi:hemoglobin/transferrin/lactoferrin receptor protein